jgi:hypothetical protein
MSQLQSVEAEPMDLVRALLALVSGVDGCHTVLGGTSRKKHSGKMAPM